MTHVTIGLARQIEGSSTPHCQYFFAGFFLPSYPHAEHAWGALLVKNSRFVWSDKAANVFRSLTSKQNKDNLLSKNFHNYLPLFLFYDPGYGKDPPWSHGLPNRYSGQGSRFPRADWEHTSWDLYRAARRVSLLNRNKIPCAVRFLSKFCYLVLLAVDCSFLCLDLVRLNTIFAYRSVPISVWILVLQH